MAKRKACPGGHVKMGKICVKDPEQDYKHLKRYLTEHGWKEQQSGETYTQGEYGTNFYHKRLDHVIHLSYDPWPDEEILDLLKGKE